MENQPKNKLAEWLDKIQQESWQLELIISGFAIFLMIGAMKAVYELGPSLDLAAAGMGRMSTFVTVTFMTLTGACLFFLINLVLHVVLRGVWISAIGLRSVSGDIDFDALKLSKRFDTYLRRKTKHFDDYIQQLDNLCSIVFAFTFLIVFMLFSLCIWVILLGFFVMMIADLPDDNIKGSLLVLILVLFLGSGLLYLIDFVTLGYLKRVKWLGRFYYPIYRFYSFITFASFYRPIYYNLIDNKFGRKAGFLLLPYVIAIVWIASLQTDSHVWFPDAPKELGLRTSFYDDLREEKSLVGSASIPSKFVKNGFLELFIRYFPSADDKVLAAICPGLKLPKNPGLSSDIVFIVGDDEFDSLLLTPAKSLECMSALYEIRLNDSLFTAPDFRFFEHPNMEEKGLITTLDVSYLLRGEHEILIKKQVATKMDGRDTVLLKDFVQFPFWKE